MRCGREAGGRNIDQLGICPAYPEEGQRCANVVGTFCDLVKALLLQSIRAARSVLFITAFILIKIPGWPIRQQNKKKALSLLKGKRLFVYITKLKLPTAASAAIAKAGSRTISFSSPALKSLVSFFLHCSLEIIEFSSKICHFLLIRIILQH